jgi:hypothetical protein
MASLKLHLSNAMKTDLAGLCSMGAERLGRAAEKIEAAPFTIRRSKIEAIIREEFNAEDGTLVMRVLFGIAGTFRREFSSADDVVSSLSRALSSLPPEEYNSRFSEWSKCSEALRALLSSQSVTLAAKAIDISYDYERVYIAGRLLTSVRPIFDDPRETIVGSTIVQTFRLEFLSPNGDRSNISVAMDMEDIQRLQKECETATRKAKAIRNRIEKDCHIEAIDPGEEISE